MGKKAGFMLQNNRLDILNIFLIVFSLVIALLFPFSWFLFAYAFIGPLHYLTEINWLNDKKYFVKTVKLPLVVLIFCTILLILPIMSPIFLSYFKIENSLLNSILVFLFDYIPVILLTSVIFSIYSVHVTDNLKLIIGLLFSVGLSILITQLPFFATVISLFLPSLIHVYLFTGLFMLFGVIKQVNKFWGLFAMCLLIVVPFVIAFIPISFIPNTVTANIKVWYSYTSFGGLVEQMATWIKPLKENETFYLLSEIGMKLQVFITFAYTYHYLNWFSKTTKIGWKNSLTTKKIKAILIIWVLSVSLYFIDIKLGLTVSLLLSFLHVIFEFPLNYLSFVEVVKYLFKGK